MILFETIAVAFAMFSAVPVPQFEWNEKNMRYALCAFPLVGAVIGLLCMAAESLCLRLGAPAILKGAILCLIPVRVTGGIHLDGYADTCDALASHADPAGKQKILADPHIGSFAVIRLCGYFVLMTAVWTVLSENWPAAAAHAGGLGQWILQGIDGLPVLLRFCLSRTLSGLAVASFPLAKDTGLAHTFASAADKSRVRKVLILFNVLLSAGMCSCGLEGMLAAAGCHAVYAFYYRLCRKAFGGLSGDLAGWFLIQAEKWMLIILLVCEWIV